MQTPASAFLLVLLATLPLHAGVVEHDFLALGDGLLTYDDVNQREWLDLTETIDWSLDSLLESLSANGPLEDFTLATKEDAAGLAASAGVEWLPPGKILPVVEGDSPKKLIDLVRLSHSCGECDEVFQGFEEFMNSRWNVGC